MYIYNVRTGEESIEPTIADDGEQIAEIRQRILRQRRVEDV